MQNYFEPHETQCKCGCGLDWTPEYRDIMNLIRDEAGFPIPVNSGARCPAYDSSLGGKGVHSKRCAGDYGVSGKQAHTLVKLGFKYGMTGIGIKQHGDHASRFVHMDTTEGETRPWLWSYK